MPRLTNNYSTLTQLQLGCHTAASRAKQISGTGTRSLQQCWEVGQEPRSKAHVWPALPSSMLQAFQDVLPTFSAHPIRQTWLKDPKKPRMVGGAISAR